MFVPTTAQPFPDCMIIDGVPIGLVAPTDGGDELISERTQPFDNVVPSEYRQASFPPYAEQTLEFRRLIGGMGMSVQEDGPPRRYHYDLFLDGSVSGLTGKGPHFHAQTGITGNPWRDRVIGLDGGVEKEFAGATRFCYVRNSDAVGGWALSKDFGLGRTVMQMTRFKNRGGTVTDSVYVVLDDGQMWQYDGAAWTPCVLPADLIPTAIEVIGDDMFAVGGQVMYSATANPLLAASWVSPVFVGEAGARANWLRALHGMLFVFKEDGVYSVSGLGGTLVVTDLFPDLKGVRSVDNGRNASLGNDALWFRWGDGQLYKVTVTGDTGLAERRTVGLGVLMDNQSEVKGKPVGMAWHGSWFGYFAVVSGADSYLCKWGTWLNPTEENPADYRFAELPNGALFKWTGKVAAVVWTSPIAGSSTNQRLYVGFADGTVEYCLLPLGSPSPYAAGSGCEFTTTPGKRYFPKVNCDFPALVKSWRAASFFARTIDGSNTVRLFYRVDGVVGFTELDDTFTYTTQRLDFPNNLGSKELELYAQLDNGTTATTPLVEAGALHYSVVPEFVLEYAGAGDARHFRARRDGTVDQRSPEVTRQVILAAIRRIGATECTMPDGSVKLLNFFRYGEQLPSKWQRYGVEHLVPFKAIDFRTTTVFGTHARLMQHTHAELEQYTHAQLERL